MNGIGGIDGVIFGLYMLVILAVGIYAATRGKSTKRDYFLAGDKLPWWMIGGSIVAANISSHHFVGVMGAAYARGFAAMTIEWGAILVGFNALLWIFLPFYLRNGFYTVPEYLQRRYGTAARMAFAGLMLLIYVFVEISAVLYLGAVVLHALTDIPIMNSVIILAVVTGIYTIAGGLRAVVWTEMLQLVVLLSGGVALSIATIRAAGGWPAVVESSKTWDILLPHNDPDFPWTMYLGGLLCISVFYAAANQFIVQRALAAKDEWHARMGIVFTDYLKFLMPLIIIVPGMLAPMLFPNLQKADEVFPTLVKNLLPPGMVGLVMAGLIAAVMGHISGAINSSMTIATIDFYIPIMRRRAAGRIALAQQTTSPPSGIGAEPLVLSYESRIPPEAPPLPEGPTDAQSVFFGRVVGVVIIIFSILWARVLIERSDKPIFLFLLNLYGVFTPGIAAMFLLGIFWKGTTHAGALTAGLLTLPLSLLMDWRFPHLPFFNRTGIVFWACMIACFVVSLFTHRKSEKELKGLIWTPGSLRLPLEERAKHRGLRRPVIWWALVTAATLFFYVWFA